MSIGAHSIVADVSAARRTARNMELFRIDAENNLLLIRGAVPGPIGGYLVIHESNKL